jgi:threonine aldolase
VAGAGLIAAHVVAQSDAARDLDAIFARCTRVVGPFGPDWTSPKAALARLAEEVGEGELGDRYGTGPIVEAFEERVARLLGTEASAFMPSGTMAQQIALRIHAEQRGRRTVAFHPTCHLELHEEKAYEQLHGLQAVLAGDAERLLSRADLEAIREPVAALLLELPQRELGGLLPDWDELVAQTSWAREHGVALHLDGARLWEAAPWYGRSHAETAGLFDSVYVSFYKGLGGLAGCALAGPTDFVDEARVWQVRHGGRLPSLYPYVVAARVGLDRNLPRMEARYRKAVEIGAAVAAHPAIDVLPNPPQTPLMHVLIRGDRDRLVSAALDVAEERRTWLFGRLHATPLPGVHRHELYVGEPAVEIPTGEIASLYAEILERASA